MKTHTIAMAGKKNHNSNIDIVFPPSYLIHFHEKVSFSFHMD